MRRKLWAPLLVAVVVAATSVYWLVLRDGPVLNARERGAGLSKLCVPAKGWPARFAIGTGSLLNDGMLDVRITDVSLAEPHEVELLGVFAADYPSDIYSGDGMHLMQVGSDHGWPPPGAERMRGWTDRQHAKGYVIEPGKEVTFLVGIRATGPATSGGLRVEYTNGLGISYTADTNPRIEVARRC